MPDTAISLLHEIVNDGRLYGHDITEGETHSKGGPYADSEVGNRVPAEGVDEATLSDWLGRAREVLGRDG